MTVLIIGLITIVIVSLIAYLVFITYIFQDELSSLTKFEYSDENNKYYNIRE